MSSILLPKVSASFSASPWLAWLPIGLGLLALYLPTYFTLAGGVWNEEEQAHGPIVLAIIVWLFWEARKALVTIERKPALLVGALSLGFGLLLYVVGRSQELLLFEVGSHIPVFAGVLLLVIGWGGLRALWFPLLFLLFLIPIPGIIIDAVTGTLKQYVSYIAETILYAAGYPIARSGVILTVGSYQLLVADACSGLHSMYSLSAIGLLYVHLMKHASRLRNVLLVLSLLPIAFLANIIRVIVLVLITYHLGDEAGQGFLHDFAGMLLFIAALGLLFMLDSVLGLFFRRRPASVARHPGSA